MLLLMVAATTAMTTTVTTTDVSNKGEGHDAGNGSTPSIILYGIFNEAIRTEMEHLRIEMERLRTEMNITSRQGAVFL
jgi:hypothetical protein